MKLKNILLIGAACAYVAAGYAAFHLLSAITGDADTANVIVACLAAPLALPLLYALGRIDALR